MPTLAEKPVLDCGWVKGLAASREIWGAFQRKLVSAYKYEKKKVGDIEHA